ncbi:MAG: ABC transporter permease [Anaerolineae bacterium]|nr:ABC transporter permease [Anaerolineae bacterium]MDQ7037509.1 ABC transporter permease [Anaerolineae bacterium]
MGVPLALRNLIHEPSKLILQIVGIAATLALIALLLGLREGMFTSLTAYINNTGADLVISQLGVKGFFSSNSAIPTALHEQLESNDSISEVRHIIVADVIFTQQSAKTPILLIGYNIDSAIGGPWNISEGRAVEGDDEILLDTWLAWRSNIKLGDAVSILGQDFMVVGLTRETSSWMSPYVFISQQAAETILQQPQTASFFLLNLKDTANANQVAQEIEAEFDGVSALTPDEMAAADRRVLATVLDAPINIMLFISTAIGIAVMGIITYGNIQARLQEYSVLKAIGANNAWLAWLVSRETLYRTGLGFIVGTGLAYLVAGLIMRAMPQFTIIIEPKMMFFVAIVALIMSLLAALLPIRQIAHIDPAKVFNQ